MTKQVEMFEFDEATTLAMKHATLKNHIDCINEKSLAEKEMNPGLWISAIRNDTDYWFDCGITTPEEFDFQMDYEACYDMIADCTSKSFARSVLANCKTVEELNEAYKKWAVS